MAKSTKEPIAVGWEEWLALPDLGLPALKAKVDTGAHTSALNAYNVEEFELDGQPKVRFIVQPLPDNPDLELVCVADLVDKRVVKSSNGEQDLRYFIETTLQLGDKKWPIEVSLSNRERMAFAMLLGRSAMKGQLIVDPIHSCVQGELDTSVYTESLRVKNKVSHLKICILSREANSYSTKRLVDEGKRRGHFVEVIDTTRCYLHIDTGNPKVYYQGEPLGAYDVVIPRIGASITFYGTAILRQLQSQGGVYCVNAAEGIQKSRDKLHAHQILAAKGIPTPKTSFAHSPHETEELVKLTGPAPLILKLLEGTQGKGVVLAETRKAAESVIDAFRGLNANFLVQEFIKEAKGEDVRCFVVGSKVVGAMKRQASEDDFRSNLHQGGNATKVKLTAEEKEVAIKAAKAMNLSIAGVDIIRSQNGPRVLEVNSSPGLEGIEKVTKKNIVEAIYEHIERYVSKHKRIKGASKL